MKIAFFCGSLEPGRDGVGDYTRRLAAACEHNGHPTLLVGLHDHWLPPSQPIRTSHELRLPVDRTLAERLLVARKCVNEFNADVLSLQFVPFAFHRYGFPHSLAMNLRAAFGKRSWHIMFHELWLGEGRNDLFKHRMLGFIQRNGIKTLIRRLQPAIMHSHAAPYRQMLDNQGFVSKPLPLFGNIAIVQKPDFGWLKSILPGLAPQSKVLVVFGAIHPEWNPALLLEKLAHPNLILLSIGRTGEAGLNNWQQFAKAHAGYAQFVHLGELDADQVSAVLQFADAGVATTPWILLEKSGSVAAMLEHGLPVIVTRNDVRLAGNGLNQSWAERCFCVWDEDFAWARLKKQPPHPALPGIAATFLHDLETALP